MNFTWRRFLNELKPVAVFLVALLGYFGLLPAKAVFLGLVIWQIVTRGSTIKDFFVTIGLWIKNALNK